MQDPISKGGRAHSSVVIKGMSNMYKALDSVSIAKKKKRKKMGKSQVRTWKIIMNVVPL